MRMQRQLMPLSITGSGSSASRFLRFVPQVVTGAAAREYTGLLTCSEEGLVHINKLNFESLERIDDGPDAEQVVYAPLTSPTEAVSSIAVASSGQYLALGTSMGTVGQYVRTGGGVDDVLKGTALFKVNDRSPNPRLAPHKESSSPLRSLSLDSDVLGNSRICNSSIPVAHLCSVSHRFVVRTVVDFFLRGDEFLVHCDTPSREEEDDSRCIAEDRPGALAKGESTAMISTHVSVSFDHIALS